MKVCLYLPSIAEKTTNICDKVTSRWDINVFLLVVFLSCLSCLVIALSFMFCVSNQSSSPWIRLLHCHHMQNWDQLHCWSHWRWQPSKFQKHAALKSPYHGVEGFLQNMIEVFSLNSSNGNTFFSIFRSQGDGMQILVQWNNKSHVAEVNKGEQKLLVPFQYIFCHLIVWLS